MIIQKISGLRNVNKITMPIKINKRVKKCYIDIIFNHNLNLRRKVQTILHFDPN